VMCDYFSYSVWQANFVEKTYHSPQPKRAIFQKELST